MKPVIVADTGPLIALAKLHLLELLPVLFTKIHVPRAVLQEATRNPEREDARSIVEFTEKYAKIEKDIHDVFSQEIAGILDEGETQALALAHRLTCGVLIDERRGRTVAHHYHIPVIGTLGVLLQGKNERQLSAIKPLIDKLQNLDYRFSETLVKYALAKAGE